MTVNALTRPRRPRLVHQFGSGRRPEIAVVEPPELACFRGISRPGPGRCVQIVAVAYSREALVPGAGAAMLWLS
jgi:hypothetical protein